MRVPRRSFKTGFGESKLQLEPESKPLAYFFPLPKVLTLGRSWRRPWPSAAATPVVCRPQRTIVQSAVEKAAARSSTDRYNAGFGRRRPSPGKRIPLTAEIWDLPQPHVVPWRVAPSDIDAFGHANNAVYVQWLDQAAWSHSADLGLPVDRCVALDRGMVVVRTTLAYLRPALLANELSIGTWITTSSSRLRVERRFQILRSSDGVTIARARIEYACVELSTGRPARWPAEFSNAYRPLTTTLASAPQLPPL